LTSYPQMFNFWRFYSNDINIDTSVSLIVKFMTNSMLRTGHANRCCAKTDLHLGSGHALP